MAMTLSRRRERSTAVRPLTPPPPPLRPIRPAGMGSRAFIPRELRIEMGPLGALELETTLTDAMRLKAREELRETEDVVPAALAKLKAMIQEEKGLTLPLDDEFLTVCLRPCHWYPDSAFEKVKNLYTFKARHPHVGRPLAAERIPIVAGSGVIGILPRRDQHGRRMLHLNTGRKWDPKKVSIDEMLCATLMCMEIALAEPTTQISGVVILWDLDGLSLSQVLKFTPSFAKMLLHLIQDCMPMRIKAFHFVNQSNIFDIAFNVFKPFLREKLRARLFFHGKDMTSLTEHVEAKLLPKQYGGVLEMVVNHENNLSAFKEFDKHFEEIGKYGYSTPPPK